MTETVAPQTDTPTQDVPTFDLYIAGEWVPSESGRTFESRNPADRRDLIGHFQSLTRAALEP